ncbi:quinoprotein dehydrogenase-associated SoxYZ-like carrier [Nitrincola tapanii]|uniref:Quinoprotein dehydrogenase-associated SoxYZ-like carrier n=1 Tax=Nitrincola tapanii TaxID=1708751 RepID=A0A5A9W8I3_9GAMM|nr:quinoprotein dehydrogenase-associated SoxYZ-like carrier [Nitrincola tapanii]KAA0876428.1 quinoprotein dehydrogenase-associated SoxYZ-like carrier [Nitrincola tapanii]
MCKRKSWAACWSRAGLVVALAISPLVAAQTEDSVMWDYTRKMFIGDATYSFDERIRVELPSFAEDSMQVPLGVDASGLNEPIQQMIAWADYNPIQHIFTYRPQAGVLPQVSLPFKVQQSTPVRVAVQLTSGEWRVGSGYVDAAGGGCTLPSESRMQDDWVSSLGQISAGRFSRASGDRFKLQVMHPMDSGLVANIPSFYLEELQVRRPSGEVLIQMQLSPAVSENPVITFDTATGAADVTLWLRDNDGNEFERAL